MNLTSKMGGHLRKLIIMRHAERVDFTFEDWILSCFDEKGNYTRNNLNMPESLPKRAGGPMDFSNDSPLTKIGHYQATLTGEAMKSCNMKFDHVFCSPSFRCVETCTNVLKATNQTHLKINIEAGLFEWGDWYKDGLPTWMDLAELQAWGFNISLDYKPVINASALKPSESCEEYYMRSFLVSSKLLESYPGNLFFVGHAATLDTCSRQLTGMSPRDVIDLVHHIRKVPYASVSVLEEMPNHTWNLINPPFPPLKHSNNLSFDWHILLS